MHPCVLCGPGTSITQYCCSTYMYGLVLLLHLYMTSKSCLRHSCDRHVRANPPLETNGDKASASMRRGVVVRCISYLYYCTDSKGNRVVQACESREYYSRKLLYGIIITDNEASSRNSPTPCARSTHGIVIWLALTQDRALTTAQQRSGLLSLIAPGSAHSILLYVCCIIAGYNSKVLCSTYAGECVARSQFARGRVFFLSDLL